MNNRLILLFLYLSAMRQYGRVEY